MKVDKAVCTKDTQKDLNKTIQYETVFTTLVENKILAIKRECESKKKIKKHKKSSKTFGKFFFGKRIFGERKDNDNNEEIKDCSECVIDIEKDEIKNAAIVDNQNMIKSTIDMGGEDIIKVTSIHNAIISDANAVSAPTDTIIIEDKKMMQHKTTIEIDSDDETPVTIHKYTRNLRSSLKDDSNGSNGNGSLDDKGVRNMVVEVITHRQGQSYDDNNGYSNNNENKMKMIEINESEQHIDSSSLGSVRIDESTNADDSLTSVKDSVESISFPSSYCTISAGVATVSNERESSRLRVLEAKSISAQCSPILARQSKPPSACFAQTQTYHPKLLESQVSYSDNHRGNYDYHGRDALRFFSRQNTSEDSVNLTVSTLLHEADSINALGERKSKSTSLLVITDKENKKAINRLDSSSIVSNQSNPLVRGFISSLNQLTTTSNYFPVITTTITALRSKASVSKTTAAVVDPLPTKSILAAVTTTPTITTTTAAAISSYDTAKLQRMTSTSTGSSVAPTGCCNTKAFSKDKDKRQKPLCHTRQSGSDDEYRKRKRKYKRYHRCSDPVLVYPSTGELQHCILSMPPNQPIQFYYNDDFLYDMTLQVEADQNGDLQAIVPSHRSKRHTHHRHKKRNRHNKPKILVHDLDTQSVKVIDPDDLPQRARWTIIATACLLLLMCLMLVGITLRMAPIIDDMG